LIGQRAPGLGDFQNGLAVILCDRISGQALAFGSPATVLGKDVHQRFLDREVVRYRFLMCCWDLSWRSLSAASLRQVSAIFESAHAAFHSMHCEPAHRTRRRFVGIL
jgi:hypothetical protein